MVLTQYTSDVITNFTGWFTHRWLGHIESRLKVYSLRVHQPLKFEIVSQTYNNRPHTRLATKHALSGLKRPAENETTTLNFATQLGSYVHSQNMSLNPWSAWHSCPSHWPPDGEQWTR